MSVAAVGLATAGYALDNTIMNRNTGDDRSRVNSAKLGRRSPTRPPQPRGDAMLALQGSTISLAESQSGSASAGQRQSTSRIGSALANRRVGSASSQRRTESASSHGRADLRAGSALSLSRPGSSVISRPQTASPTEQYINSPPSETEETHYLYDGTIIPLATQSEPGGYRNTPANMSQVDFAPKRSVTSFSEPARFAAARGFCVRSRSALMRETEGLVTSLCRQCCDVLGPKICHECAIIRRRDREAKKYESFLPRVEITTENLSTTLLISKTFPDMALEDIQKKLSEGDISKPAFRLSVQRLKEKRQKEAAKCAITTWKKTNQGLVARDFSYTFFRSVKDLNRKIMAGQVTRKIIITGDPDKDRTAVPKVKVADGTSFSESVSPTFVSPRKGAVVAVDKEKWPTSLYEPPLLPVVCQNVEPVFFAGKQSAYTLPPSRGMEPVKR